MAKQTTSTPQVKTGGAGGSGSRPVRPKAGTPGGDVAGKASVPSIMTFFQESRNELRKVSWPTRQETSNLTVAVIAMTVAISAFLGIIDSLLDFVVKPLIGAK